MLLTHYRNERTLPDILCRLGLQVSFAAKTKQHIERTKLRQKVSPIYLFDLMPLTDAEIDSAIDKFEHPPFGLSPVAHPDGYAIHQFKDAAERLTQEIGRYYAWSVGQVPKLQQIRLRDALDYRYPSAFTDMHVDNISYVLNMCKPSNAREENLVEAYPLLWLQQGFAQQMYTFGRTLHTLLK